VSGEQRNCGSEAKGRKKGQKCNRYQGKKTTNLREDILNRVDAKNSLTRGGKGKRAGKDGKDVFFTMKKVS